MTTDRGRPLQFHLRSVFVLTAAVGLMLWLSRGVEDEDAPLIVPIYLFIGLAQIVVARFVWRHLTPLGGRSDLDRDACEMAVAACGLTLGPWALIVVSLAFLRLGLIELLPHPLTIVLFAAGLVLAVVTHALGLIVNLINLVLAMGALRHVPLLALVVLNAANTGVPILLLWWELAH